MKPLINPRTIYAPQTESPKDAVYRAYIGGSKNWKGKRIAIARRDNGKCCNCASTHALHIHHIRYKHVYNEKPDDLITLCNSCHKKAHDAAQVVENTIDNAVDMEKFVPWVPAREYIEKEAGDKPTLPTKAFQKGLIALSKGTDYESASLEWMILGAYDRESKCLCGAKPIHIAEIENTNNGNNAHIGGKCLTHLIGQE